MSETGKTTGTGYITASEAAQKLGYRYEPFIRALRNGRVPGAKKHGRFWMVPEDSEVRSKYRYLTFEEHEELVRLATSGVPKKELAARFGCQYGASTRSCNESASDEKPPLPRDSFPASSYPPWR